MRILLFIGLLIGIHVAAIEPDPYENQYRLMEQELLEVKLVRMHETLNPAVLNQLKWVDYYYYCLDDITQKYSKEKDRSRVFDYAVDYTDCLEKMKSRIASTDSAAAAAALEVGGFVQAIANQTGGQLARHWDSLGKKLAAVDTGYRFWLASKRSQWADEQMQSATDPKERHKLLRAAVEKWLWIQLDSKSKDH